MLYIKIIIGNYKYIIVKKMYKNLFVACLLIAAATSTIFLTPAYPPTAIQNQFYNVRFRVRGLDDPVFTF